MINYGNKFIFSCAAAALALTFATSANAKRQKISNDMGQCAASANGPALKVVVTGIKKSSGKIRVQSYRATSAEWLKKGEWLNRIDATAAKGSMTFCMPVPSSGDYGIAVRHDINGDGKTNIFKDGGGFSNNPSLTMSLGKPSYTKTKIAVGSGIKTITINLQYF